MTCPHCWPPDAQRAPLSLSKGRAAENAATVARERDVALLARLLREGTDAERIQQTTKKV